jgi:hypothetical protein
MFRRRLAGYRELGYRIEAASDAGSWFEEGAARAKTAGKVICRVADRGNLRSDPFDSS